MAGLPMFHSRKAQKVFLFSITSRPALGPTQLSLQWIPGAVSADIKWPGRQADRWTATSAEVKNGGAIPPLPRCSD
jgi:hypothetical protein